MDLDAVFGNTGPFEVDIGCGKCHFLLARARKDPAARFLGIDRMLRRLRKADRAIGRQSLRNLWLLRADADYTLRYLIPAGSVRACYVFFPDPWPKRRHHRRRLFCEEFLDTLARSLQVGGCLHFATDHRDYFESVPPIFGRDPRFAAADAFTPADDERTEFERRFIAQGLPIWRASFRLRDRGAG